MTRKDGVLLALVALVVSSNGVFAADNYRAGYNPSVAQRKRVQRSIARARQNAEVLPKPTMILRPTRRTPHTRVTPRLSPRRMGRLGPPEDPQVWVGTPWTRIQLVPPPQGK